MPTDSEIAATLAELRSAVTTLQTTMTGMEKRLHLVYSVVVLVVGVVGGPNAVQAILGQ